MAAYVIFKADEKDWDRSNDGPKETPRVIARNGGEETSRSGEEIVPEGSDHGRRMIVIKFPSLQKATEWCDSEEYRQVKSQYPDSTTAFILAPDDCF